MAIGDDVVRNPLGQTLVKDEVLAHKLVAEARRLGLARVLDDAALQLMDIGKSLVLEVGTGLFAPDAARAVHHNVGVFLVLQHVLDQGDLLPEGVHVRTNGAFEMPHFALVRVAHVDEDRVLLVGQGVELVCLEVLAAIGHVERVVVQPVGHNFLFHPDNQLEETLALFHRHIQPQVGKPTQAFQMRFELLKAVGRHGNLSVDAFAGHVGSAQHAQLFPRRVQLVPRQGGVFQVDVPVKAEGGARHVVLLHAGHQHPAVLFVVPPFHSATKVRQAQTCRLDAAFWIS